jgi:2-keto-4-pentenoate hydratase/2-oxohepta-3-ene-1,7-dioic acid hydratase in catechol pathway
MRITRFESPAGPCWGLVQGATVVPLETHPFEGIHPRTERLSFRSLRLLPPVDPPNIIGIGLNYRKHAEETKARPPDEPIIFLKATSSLIGPGEPILLPREAPDENDYEAELCVVIGKRARHVSTEEALSYVLGYCCGNDVSARDCQFRRDRQWARGKSFDTFAAIGPWIETELDPAALRILGRLNGQIVQDSTTEDMIFSVPEIVSRLSRSMTLLPGTVIMTGTPSGVGTARTPPRYLREGDVFEVEIGGVGTLQNPVRRET